MFSKNGITWYRIQHSFTGNRLNSRKYRSSEIGLPHSERDEITGVGKFSKGEKRILYFSYCQLKCFVPFIDRSLTAVQKIALLLRALPSISLVNLFSDRWF